MKTTNFLPSIISVSTIASGKCFDDQLVVVMYAKQKARNSHALGYLKTGKATIEN